MTAPYPGNAPFPLANGIPDTEPVDQRVSSFSAASALAEISPTADAHFRFTFDHPRLNRSQRLFYEQNGFLVIPKLVPDELLDKSYLRFLDIINGKVEKGEALGVHVLNNVRKYVNSGSLEQACSFFTLISMLQT